MSSPMPITVFGVKYSSLREAARAFNFPESTLRKYLNVYHAEPEPLLACSDGLVYLSFIGSDGRAYYMIPVPEIHGYFTARQIVEHYRPDLVAAYDAVNPTGEYRPYTKGGGK